MQYIDLTSRDDCASFDLPLDKWKTVTPTLGGRSYKFSYLPCEVVKEKYKTAAFCESCDNYGAFVAVLQKDGSIRCLETYPWKYDNPIYLYAVILEDGDTLITQRTWYPDDGYLDSVEYAALYCADLARICSIYGYDRGHAPKEFRRRWNHSTATIKKWLVDHGYDVAVKQYEDTCNELLFKEGVA